LAPGLDKDYRRIASLHGALPSLIEAAPRPLLSALGQLIEGDGAAIRPIFQDAEGTSVFGTESPHSELLRALETLAWVPYYFGDAVQVLAKLARVDPGGRLGNRPINSLFEIFRPWHPSTNSGFEQRFGMLDWMIRHEPTVARQLLAKVLAGAHRSGSFSASLSARADILKNISSFSAAQITQAAETLHAVMRMPNALRGSLAWKVLRRVVTEAAARKASKFLEPSPRVGAGKLEGEE
jgi:hypothetical protein